MIYSVKISVFLSNISDVFFGQYTHKNNEINELRDEILDVYVTPTQKTDKVRLRNDFNSVIRDTKKAKDKIKQELVNIYYK